MVDLGIGRPAAHALLAELIDVRLDKHVGERGNSHLQRCGNADMDNLTKHFTVKTDFGHIQVDAGTGAQQGENGQHGGNGLGDDGGVGHALHTHVENDHEQQIQNGIDHRCGHQKVKGTAGVAHGTQDACAHVIEHQTGHAGEIDRQVGGRLAKDLAGGLHKTQHDGGHGYAEDGKENGHDNGQGDGSVNRVLNLIIFFGSVILRDHHARAAGQSHERTDEHVDDGRYRAHSRKGGIADVVSNDPGVHGVVKLLEHVARQQRQRKDQQVAEHVALGHVYIVALFVGAYMCLCHGAGPPL